MSTTLDQFALHRASAIDGKVDTLHLGICDLKERIESLERDIQAMAEHQVAIHHQLAAQGMQLGNIEALIRSLRTRLIP